MAYLTAGLWTAEVILVVQAMVMVRALIFQDDNATARILSIVIGAISGFACWAVWMVIP